MKILLIEDNNLVRESLIDLLEYQLEQSLVVCENAEDGLKALKFHDFPLIVTDYSLPGMNGLQFIEKTKRIVKELPTFILVTGSMDEVLFSKAISDGIHFLQKPVDIFKIIEIIDSLASQP